MADRVRNWIFALLSSNGTEPMTLTQLEAQYKELDGCFIPARKLGFPDTISLLQSMDNVQVKTMGDRILVKATACVDTQHVVKLIKDQKKNPAKTSPWIIPQAVENNILAILGATSHGQLALSQLNAQYMHLFDAKLPAPRGHMLAWLKTATKFIVTNENNNCHMIQPMRDLDMTPYNVAGQRLRIQALDRVRNRLATQPNLSDSRDRPQRGKITESRDMNSDRGAQTQWGAEASRKKHTATAPKPAVASADIQTSTGWKVENPNESLAELDKVFSDNSAALTAPSVASVRARIEPIKAAQKPTISVNTGPAVAAPEPITTTSAKTELATSTRPPPVTPSKTTVEPRCTMPPRSCVSAPARTPKRESPRAGSVPSADESTRTSRQPMVSASLKTEPIGIEPHCVTSSSLTLDSVRGVHPATPSDPLSSRTTSAKCVPQPRTARDLAKNAIDVPQEVSCRPKTNRIRTEPHSGTPALASLEPLSETSTGSPWSEPAKLISQPTPVTHDRVQHSPDPSLPPSQTFPIHAETASTTSDALKRAEVSRPNSVVLVNTVRRQVTHAVLSNQRLTCSLPASSSKSSANDPTQGCVSPCRPPSFAPLTVPTTNVKQVSTGSLQRSQPPPTAALSSRASAEEPVGADQAPLGPAPVISVKPGMSTGSCVRMPPPQWIVQMATRSEPTNVSKMAEVTSNSIAKLPLKTTSASGENFKANLIRQSETSRSYADASLSILITRTPETLVIADQFVIPPVAKVSATGDDQWQCKTLSATRTPTEINNFREWNFTHRRNDVTDDIRRQRTLPPLPNSDEPVVELFGLPLEKLLNLVSFLQEHPPISRSFLNDLYFAAYSEELISRDLLGSLIDMLVAQDIVVTGQGSHSVTVTAKGSRPCEMNYFVKTTSINAQNDVSIKEIQGKVEGSDELGYKLLPVRNVVDVSTLQSAELILAGEAYMWVRGDRHDVVVAKKCVSNPGPTGCYWVVCTETGAQAIVNDRALYKLAGSGVEAPVCPMTIWPAGKRPANGEIVSLKVIKRVPNGPVLCRLSDEELFSVYLSRYPSDASVAPIRILRWGGLTYLLSTSLTALGVQSKSEIPLQCMKYADALIEFLGREGVPANSSFVSVTDLIELLAQKGVERELIIDILRL
ncbi:hypothetical protein BIW11_14004 [Tropilaelaps mercedesae]|uniref:HTH OST-type domain-containing protein n=1 Tax=Tropilaelaps mercedesae TaxID=418985 RepID=A0A1V9WZH0_9ACAR|nr:hypothetical protein BIW11_14004 [Tropilaelaps mercedesae]